MWLRTAYRDNSRPVLHGLSATALNSTNARSAQHIIAHCKMAAQQLAVNVVDFAKARLPELEALDEELDKNQRDAPRHLRRRARSHTAPFLREALA